MLQKLFIAIAIKAISIVIESFSSTLSLSSITKIASFLTKALSRFTIKAKSILQKLFIAIAIEAISIAIELFNSISSLSSMTTKIVSSLTKVSFRFIIKAKSISIIVDKFLLALRTNIDFYLMKELIYYIKNDRTRLCISRNIKSIVMKATHDDYFHANHHKVYVKLSDSIYIHKLFKKLIIYIRHCS